MDTLVYLSLLANIGGLVFYFTSGAFALLSSTLGIIFQGLGLILIYMGVSIILIKALGSMDVLLDSLGKQT